MDYCNSVTFVHRSLSSFSPTQAANASKLLQCPFQNTLARIVTNSKWFTSTTPTLKKLHWLPVEQRSVFKTATLVYKFLNCGYPKYFSTFLSLSIIVHTIPGVVGPTEISLLYLNFVHLYTNPKGILVIVLPMMLQRYGMICLMRFALLHLLPLSEKNSRHTYSPKPIHHNIFSVSSCCLCGVDPCYVPQLWLLPHDYVCCALESVLWQRSKFPT